MDDWRNIIKQRIEEYNGRRVEITKEFNLLLNDLAVSPFNIKAKVLNTHEENEIIWDIGILNKIAFISEKDIKNNKKETADENGNIKELEYDSLKENLISLILSKFEW